MQAVGCGKEQSKIQKNDRIFIPAGGGAYTVTGACRILYTTV